MKQGPSNPIPWRTSHWPLLLLAIALLGGCEKRTVLSPFGQRAPGDAGANGDEEGAPEVSDLLVADDEAPEDEERDPTLGGRCLDDEQCDDGIDCTFDECDLSLQRCRFTPDDSKCQDELYCNGREECRSGIGCRAGEPVSCDDQSPCSIDRCVEETMGCERVIRDTDADGDPDAHCVESGGDCNDQDPRVSSLRAEVCNNRRDDDCDGVSDEDDCERPEFDTCDVPLLVDEGTTLRVSMQAATADTAASCSAPDAADVVVALEVDEPSDVTITVRGQDPSFSVAARRECEEAASELSCAAAVEVSALEAVARLRLVAAEGNYALVVFDDSNDELEVSVEFDEPSLPSDNETCDRAEALSLGQATTARLFGASPDVESACHDGAGDLFYSFEIDQISDVRVFATPADLQSEPLLSLRTEGCASLEHELACINTSQTELFARALPAGTYYLAVAATLATEMQLLVTAEEPTSAPAGDRCDDPRELPLGEAVDVDLASYADDVPLVCHPAGKEAVFRLELAESSDVLVKQRFTLGDQGAVSLLQVNCDPAQALGCTVSELSPVRVVAHDLPAGVYSVIVETALGNPAQVLAAARPARPPVVVIGADACEDAQPVPATGGYFTGNTSTASPDFTASCDVGAFPEGAPDQLLRFELEERSRVILDAAGSSYRTVVNLRQGPECPGTQVPLACAAAVDESEFIEVVLEAGVYFIQMDGFAGDSGQWELEVFILPER